MMYEIALRYLLFDIIELFLLLKYTKLFTPENRAFPLPHPVQTPNTGNHL